VVEARGTMLKAGRSQVRDPMRWMNFFSIYIILLATLGPGVHSEMSTRSRRIMFLGSRALQMHRAYRQLWAECLDNVGSWASHDPIALHCLLQGVALLLHFYVEKALAKSYMLVMWIVSYMFDLQIMIYYNVPGCIYPLRFQSHILHIQ
jgi:hypothetical protein